MLLAVYLHECFIDADNIAVVTMFAFQSTSMNCTEPGTRKENYLAHNISAPDIESKIQPDRIVDDDDDDDDAGMKSVAFVCIYPTILPTTGCLTTAKASKMPG
jgi:hypothetical protein